MTDNLSIFGSLVEAEENTRELKFKLLPFGEPGRTNLGEIHADKGVIEIPEAETLELNEEHDYTRPIGKFSSVEEREDGIYASVNIVETTAGNDALKLARAGLRTGISVEIADPIIENGQLTAGRLTGAGLVVRPAFDNARLVEAAENETEEVTPMENNETFVQPEPLTAGADKVELGALTFNAAKSGASVQAALADQLPADDTGKVYIRDQEIGELWEARKVNRPVIEKIGVKPLNSLFVTGHKKARTFEVGDWAGSKVELPTGKFTTSRENWQAKSKAVAVDVAMELVEFGSEDVISELYEQAMDSYIEQTESEVIASLVAGGTQVPAGAEDDAISVINKAADTLGAIGANMSIVACAPDVFATLRGIKAVDAPWWLAKQGSVNLANGSADLGSGVVLTSNPELAAGTVVVADHRAIDYRESKDFRYKALDLPRGGVDISLIKFNAEKITDNGAVLVFTGVGVTV